MAEKKKLADKADKRRRRRVWCGEYKEDCPTSKVYHYITYNSSDSNDMELQTRLARERWGVGVYAHIRKEIPIVQIAALPYVDGQPLITIDSQGQANTTFGEFAWGWYNEQISKADLAESSKSCYRAWLNSHLMPRFGHRIIREISVSELQGFLFEYEGESYSIVSKLKMTIKQIFAFAASKKLVNIEVLGQLTTLRNPKTNKGERRALTEEEQKIMRLLGKTHINGLLLLILFWLGLRRGEALGLRWSDFDYQNKTVYIQRDIDFKDDNGQLKTRAANRYIPVSSELIEALEAIRPEDTILSDEMRQESDYLFKGSKSNMPICESTFKRMWDRLMIAAYELDSSIEAKEIKTGDYRGKMRSILTPHYFRHNFATMLCDWKVSPEEAIAYMGHEDSEMIREIYAHRSKRAQAQNAELFQQKAAEYIEYLQKT